jgi:hypothetical protein
LSIQHENPIETTTTRNGRLRAAKPVAEGIGKISRLAELEIARYAVEHLKRDDLVAPEAAE